MEENTISLNFIKSLEDFTDCTECKSRQGDLVFSCGHVFCIKCIRYKKDLTSRSSCAVCKRWVSESSKLEDVAATLRLLLSVIKSTSDDVLRDKLVKWFQLYDWKSDETVDVNELEYSNLDFDSMDIFVSPRGSSKKRTPTLGEIKSQKKNSTKKRFKMDENKPPLDDFGDDTKRNKNGKHNKNRKLFNIEENSISSEKNVVPPTDNNNLDNEISLVVEILRKKNQLNLHATDDEKKSYYSNVDDEINVKDSYSTGKENCGDNYIQDADSSINIETNNNVMRKIQDLKRDKEEINKTKDVNSKNIAEEIDLDYNDVQNIDLDNDYFEHKKFRNSSKRRSTDECATNPNKKQCIDLLENEIKHINEVSDTNVKLNNDCTLDKENINHRVVEKIPIHIAKTVNEPFAEKELKIVLKDVKYEHFKKESNNNECNADKWDDRKSRIKDPVTEKTEPKIATEYEDLKKGSMENGVDAECAERNLGLGNSINPTSDEKCPAQNSCDLGNSDTKSDVQCLIQNPVLGKIDTEFNNKLDDSKNRPPEEKCSVGKTDAKSPIKNAIVGKTDGGSPTKKLSSKVLDQNTLGNLRKSFNMTKVEPLSIEKCKITTKILKKSGVKSLFQSDQNGKNSSALGGRRMEIVAESDKEMTVPTPGGDEYSCVNIPEYKQMEVDNISRNTVGNARVITSPEMETVLQSEIPTQIYDKCSNETYFTNSPGSTVILPKETSLSRVEMKNVSCQTTSDLHIALLERDFPELFAKFYSRTPSTCDKSKISDQTPLATELKTPADLPTVWKTPTFTGVSEPTSSERKQFDEDVFLNSSVVGIATPKLADQTVDSDCSFIDKTPISRGGRIDLLKKVNVLKENLEDVAEEEKRPPIVRCLSFPHNGKLTNTVDGDITSSGETTPMRPGVSPLEEKKHLTKSDKNVDAANPCSIDTNHMLDSENGSCLQVENMSPMAEEDHNNVTLTEELANPEIGSEGCEMGGKNKKQSTAGTDESSLLVDDSLFVLSQNGQSSDRLVEDVGKQTPIRSSNKDNNDLMEAEPESSEEFVASTPTPVNIEMINDGTLKKLHERSKTFVCSDEKAYRKSQNALKFRVNSQSQSPKETDFLFKCPSDPVSQNSNISEKCSLEEEPKFQTPEAYPVPALETKPERKEYELVPSGLTATGSDVVKEFAKKMMVRFSNKITNTTTHLIVKVDKYNRTQRTFKFLQALSKHICVVSVEWIRECNKLDAFIDEENFIPLDCSGECSPLRSYKALLWAENPLYWLKNYCFYFLPPASSPCTIEQLQELMYDAGAAVVKKLEEFRNFPAHHKIIITADEVDSTELIKFVAEWLCTYKAATVSFSWIVEVIGKYRLIPFVKYESIFIPQEYLLKLNFPSEMLEEIDSDDEDLYLS